MGRPKKGTPHTPEKLSRMPTIKADGSWTSGRLDLSTSENGKPYARNATQRWYGFVRKAEALGVLPVDVMIDNIHFEHRQVTGLTAEINRMVVELQEDPDLSADAKAQMLGEVSSMLASVKGARSRAQQYACDLAPFLHPKLAMITVSDATGQAAPAAELASQIVQLNQDDAAQTYLRLVKGEEVLAPEDDEERGADPNDVAGD